MRICNNMDTNTDKQTKDILEASNPSAVGYELFDG